MKPKGLITIINHNTKIYRRETFQNLNQIARKNLQKCKNISWRFNNLI